MRAEVPSAQPGVVLQRDLRLLLVNRVLRAFAFGASALLLSFELERRGLSAFWIGVVLSLGLGTASLAGLLSAAAAARFGRRRSLAATGVLMAISGLDVAFAPNAWLLAVAPMTGMLASGTMDVGPFLAVEQAVLTETAGPRERNRAFARYALTGSLAFSAGAAVAGLASGLGLGQAFFLLYAVAGLATAAIPLALSKAVEGDFGVRPAAFGNARPIFALAALFALDSFGGGWVVQSVLVYWLHVRFGTGSAVLGSALAAMNLLSAISYEVSGRTADRFGLINTMFFTHVPSNLLLVLVPFSPNLAVALAILLVRAAIGNMDSPARQAYVVSIVKPSERAGAVALTGAFRGVTLAAGPVLTGLAIQSTRMAVPFVLGGSIKLIYDFSLYAGFRRRRASHERAG